MSLLIARCVATAVLSLAGIAGEVVAVVAEPAEAKDNTSTEIGARFVLRHLEGPHVAFKAYAIRSRSVLARLGVQAGDVITHVHGAAMTDVTPIVNAIRAYATGVPFDLTVERAGEVRVLRSP
jgi:membrane-associated protease RseP (regulator of RpoE activity)